MPQYTGLCYRIKRIGQKNARRKNIKSEKCWTDNEGANCRRGNAVTENENKNSCNLLFYFSVRHFPVEQPRANSVDQRIFPNIPNASAEKRMIADIL